MDQQTGKVVYSHSRSPGLFFDSETPYQGNWQQLLPITLGRLPADQVEKNVTLDKLGLNLDQIEKNYDDEFIGPVASKAGKLGQYNQFTASEKAALFYPALEDMRNTLLYLQSGKQIHESEYERLRAALPDENTSPTDFRGRMQTFKKIYAQIRQSRESQFRGAGYYFPKPTPKMNPMPSQPGQPGATGESPEQRKARLLQELRGAK